MGNLPIKPCYQSILPAKCVVLCFINTEGQPFEKEIYEF